MGTRLSSGFKLPLLAAALLVGALTATGDPAGAATSRPIEAPRTAAPATIAGVEAWGYGATGELGDGALGTAGPPVAVEDLSGVAAISAGAHHSLALLTNGTVMAWGQNDFGQLGTGSTSAFSTTPVPVSNLTGVVAVSAGDGHSLALLSDGTVMAWGDNSYGQLGDGRRSPFSAVPVEVHGLSGVSQIAAGNRDSLALLSNGTVWAWGNNAQGQLGDGANSDISTLPVQVKRLNDAIQVAAGGEHSVALLKTGKVMAWGFGDDGENGNGLSENSDVPVAVSNVSHATSVTAGDEFDLALHADGRVQGWGGNGDGELGNPQYADAPLPIFVSGLTGVTNLSSGDGFSLALTGGGEVFGWGDNSFKEMAGAASEAVVQRPVPLANVTNALELSAGGVHALVATSVAGGGPPVGPTSYGFVTPQTGVKETGPPFRINQESLSAVSAASAADAWAVETINPLEPTPGVESLHWAGKRWSSIPFASPASGSRVINGIYDAGPGNAWAAGTITLPNTTQTRTLIEHWSGSSWSVVASPNPAGGAEGFDALSGIGGSGPDDIWVVGDYFFNVNGGDIFILAAHYDGSTWTVKTVPQVGAFDFGRAVASTSTTSAWLVGIEAPVGSGDQGLAFHWDGSKWTDVPVPNVMVTTQTGDELTGVTIAAANDVWVSAYADQAPDASVPYVLHDDGTGFKATKLPAPGGPQVDFPDVGSFLYGISASGPSDVYAVGLATFNDSTQLSLVEHFNGSSWSSVAVPQPGDRGALGEVPGNEIQAVSVPAQGTVFMGGAEAWPQQLFGSIPIAVQTPAG